MTVTNPNTYRTLRPLLVSFFVHIILWYSLYVVALLQTAPPLWALNFIEQLKPTLGALETAARLSERPFSTQVMILYAILSSFLLGMYWVYYIFGVQHFAQETYRGLCERWGHTGLPVKVRLKLAACGVAALYAYGYELPIRYYVKGGVPQQLAEFSTVLLVDPVDHLLVARVDNGGYGLRAWPFVHLYVNRSFSIPHINKETTMSTETVEIAIGLNAHVLNGPLASAQSALLAQLKAVGNDLGSLHDPVLGQPNYSLNEQGLCG